LRIYGIISSLALICLGGFRVTRSRISLELSPLGERRVRNQELVILREEKKKQDMTYKPTENTRTKAKIFELSKRIPLARGGQSRRSQKSELGFLSPW
jgi:hypothetical protein